MRCALLCGRRDGTTDAIHDYASWLAPALCRRGIDAQAVSLGGPGADLSSAWQGVRPLLNSADAVVVQYNPFSFGRRGFAPRLVWELIRLARMGRAPRLILMCHEIYYSPFRGVRSILMSSYQRMQLVSLLYIVDVTLVSISPWLDAIRWLGGSGASHLPVGSNLPDHRAHRASTRRELGVTDDVVVLASFGQGHPAAQDAYIVAAVERLEASGANAVLLSLGAGRRPVLGSGHRTKEVLPGPLPAEAVADYLAGADIFMSTYVDGVSTRRGTVMAALQHEMAVVGTRGKATDPELTSADAGLSLVDVDAGPLGFAQRVAVLASDPGRRTGLRARGRLTYESRYDWDVIAERLAQLGMPNG